MLQDIFDRKEHAQFVITKTETMTTQSYLEIFTEANSNFITTVMIDPIVAHYKNNPDDEITHEKIMEILKLPAPSGKIGTPQRSTTQQPLTTTTTKRSRSKVTEGQPQCKWIFTKGDNIGQRCQGKAVEGLDYCSACRTKKGAGGSGRKASSTGNKASVAAGAPKGAGTTKGKSTGASTAKTKNPPEKVVEVSVEDFGHTTDGYVLVVDTNSNYILKEYPGGVYTIVGICDNPDETTMRELSEAEIEQGRKSLQLEYEQGVVMADD